MVSRVSEAPPGLLSRGLQSVSSLLSAHSRPAKLVAGRASSANGGSLDEAGNFEVGIFPKVMMMNREQMNDEIEQVCESFQGQFPDLFQMVGIVVVGRLFGWRVIRLVVPRRIWTMLMRTFGDPKVWMPERGRLAYKSSGLKMVESMGDYWGFIRGSVRREIPDKNLAI
jgi:hypothetical protein